MNRGGQWYCKQHDPEAEKARRQASDKRYEDTRAEMDRRDKAAAKLHKDREACHEACNRAGLSPATLAADPDCIKRVVEAATVCARAVTYMDKACAKAECITTLAAIGKEPV